MATNTTNNYFSKPAVGGDTDTWGTTLNANWDTVDSVLAGDTDILALSVVPASATDIAATFTGLVGIGTSSPLYNLVVNDAASSVIQIRSGSDDAGHLYFADTDDDNIGGVSYSHEYNFMNFKTNDTERMRIDSSGKVGIGTTSPVSALDVRGDISVGGSGAGASQLGVLRSWSNTADADIYALMPSGGSAAGTIIEGRPNAHVVIGLKDNDNLDSFNVIGTGGTYSDVGSEADNAYDTNLFCVRSTGNVGIGTSNPQSDGNTTNLEVSSAFGSRVLVNNTDTNGRKYGIYSDNAGRFGFADYTADATRMLIDSSGNVGIGTDSPDATLEVNSGTTNKVATFKSSDATAFIQVEDSNTTATTHGYGVNSNNLSLYANGTERMRIEHSGKVGIGTTDPDEALHVVGNIKIEGTLAKLEFLETDANPDWSIINSEGALAFYDETADTTRMKLDTSGHLRTDAISCLTNQQLVLNVGESASYATGQTAEALYVNAESGLQVNSSANNWQSGWSTNRYTTTIGDSNGASIFPTDIYVANRVLHVGDTNTYTQFHAADQWRVVTGGSERLEVNNTAVTTTTQFVGKGAVGYTDVSFVSTTDDDQTVTFSIPSGHAVINALITTSGFNYNAIKSLKNNSCIINRYNSEDGSQTVNLRVWHSKV